ncbi:MAG: hypothetical protein CL927_04840 [Deltaproteobacteria bacterium]|nr:hypothetical protein [Deltaproteobacteria bacterium]
MDPTEGTPLAGTPLAPITLKLVEDGWPIQHDQNEPTIFTTFEGKNGRRRAVVVFEPELERLLVYAILVETSTESSRSPQLELLTRINYGLGTGCFEMDLDDGEIRYRVTLPAAMAMPHVLVPMLVDACMTVDTYAPAFDSVVDGTPVQAALHQLQTTFGA